MKYRYSVLISATILALIPALGFAQEKPAGSKQEAGEKPAATPAPAAAPESKQPVPAETQTPPEYLDNRSTPESVIKSYYNAINRQEYARAYSYYASDSPPQPFPQFQAGYENTTAVTVLFGDVEGEGAAGSAYWSQPLAIKSEAKDGTVAIYNGCYRLKLANPAIQGVPFVPLSLIDGTLQKSEKTLEESVPEGCEAP